LFGPLIKGFPRRGRGALLDVRRHLTRLAPLKIDERLEYVSSRAIGKTQQVIGSRTGGLRKAMQMLVWKTHLRMGLRIPLRLRSAYILDIYTRARLAYLPQVYRGRTILFRGEQLSRWFQKDWDGLLEGHLERFNLGEVDHMKLREEANVHLWARQLKVSLSKAQAEVAMKEMIRR
jgi:hypothetical protein